MQQVLCSQNARYPSVFFHTGIITNKLLLELCTNKMCNKFDLQYQDCICKYITFILSTNSAKFRMFISSPLRVTVQNVPKILIRDRFVKVNQLLGVNFYKIYNERRFQQVDQLIHFFLICKLQTSIFQNFFSVGILLSPTFILKISKECSASIQMFYSIVDS